MKVDVYSHSFMVSELSARQAHAVGLFCKGLVQMKMDIQDGRRIFVPLHTFAASPADRRYVRFHINLLPDFGQHIRYHQIGSQEVQTTRHEFELTDRFRVDFPVEFLPPPRDPQPAIIDHIVSPGPNKIVTLQTGKGKTMLTKYGMEKQQLRTAIFMRGGFIEQWIRDMEKSFKFKRGELLNVRGSVPLSTIMEMAVEGEFEAKLTFISINTYSEYIKHYEEHGVTEQYPIAPQDFFERMGIGFAVLDEGHQFPHQVMKLFAYTHVHKFLELSATLDTRDKFLARMYEIMYPTTDRFNAGYYDAYIKVTAILYQTRKLNSIRCTGFGGAYNHNTFEASLMQRKHKVELQNYTDMICWYVSWMVDQMAQGQKILVFCGTINFCTLIQKLVQRAHSHLKVVRYVGSKDKRSVMDDADIIISTVQSAGTAVDLPNLRWGFMTTAMDSQQANEQTLGRTRRLVDWPEITPEFMYFVCTNIDKHVRYHENKKLAFRGKVLAHLEEQAPFSV